MLHILYSGHTGQKSVFGVRMMGDRVSVRFERLVTICIDQRQRELEVEDLEVRERSDLWYLCA